MIVEVKKGKTGFILGKLMRQGEEFELGKNKFSKNWMEKVIEKEVAKSLSQLNVSELREILDKADIDYPEGAKKPDLKEFVKGIDPLNGSSGSAD